MTEEKVLNKGIEGEITDKELDQVAGGGEGKANVPPVIYQKGDKNMGFDESLNDNEGTIVIK